MFGLGRNNIAIKIMRIPEREKPCLFIQEDNVDCMVGQFKDEEAAELFWKALDYVIFDNGDFSFKYADKDRNQLFCRVTEE